MNNSKVIYLASRYRADTDEQFEKQLDLTKEFSREVVAAGHDVVAPHLYYPLFLDDNDEQERLAGTQSAIRLLDVCEILYVHMGAGISEGMKAEIEAAQKKEMLIRPFKDIEELKFFLELDASQGN